MAAHIYIDPPPSYAEATGTSRHNDQADTRRHTLASISSAVTSPVYSQRSNSSSNAAAAARPLFPPAFSLYSQCPHHYIIGTSQNAPLHAVSTSSSLSPRPDIIIHNGITQDMPALATVAHEPFSRSATITLPARPGSRLPAAHELLESVGAFTRVLSFSIETAASTRSRREHFEWRHSSGVEVEALGGRHSGWKLVRVSLPSVRIHHRTTTTPFSSSLLPSSYHSYSYSYSAKKHGINSSGSAWLGHSSDGKEVVAVCAAASIAASRKVLRFRFLGSGADGSLGDRWAVMAVASALAIWNRDRRSRSGGSATVSAGF
ncbi:hypothetical protein F5Y12DRAFT_101602 [Xylaria sp. FL1777]|nr:hypothetical protein F5Y12DRAFT_101602 [Xylaria sp. FL1777]